MRSVGGAIDVAAGIRREMFVCPFAVDRLGQDIGAEARAIAADGHAAGREVQSVHAHLADAPVGGREAGLLRQDVADHLRVDELGIEVDGREVVPRTVTGEIHAVILHRRTAAARAADSHPGVVQDSGLARVGADEGDIELRVALVVHIDQAQALGGGEDKAEERLAASHDLVIHLELGVRLLHRQEKFIQGGRRPGAGVRTVGGLHVVLEDRAAGLGVQHRAVNAVTHCAVAVRAIVEHRRAGKGRRGGGGGVAVEERHRETGGKLIDDARVDGDLVGRARDGGRMGHVVNQRGNVVARRAVAGAGAAVGRGAGRPVLPVVERQGGID